MAKTSKTSKLNITENFFGDDASTYQKRRKTQLCTRVFTGQACRYGSDCNYVHDISELFVLSCNYNSKCEWIVKKDGKYENFDDEKTICSHVHPGEDLLDYCKRTKKFPTGLKPATKLVEGTPAVPTLIPAVVVTRVFKTTLPSKKIVAIKTAKPSENTKPPSFFEVEVKSQVKTKPAVIKEEPIKARSSADDDDSALVIEFDESGHMVVVCKSDQDVQMAFKMALESKQSIRIKKV